MATINNVMTPITPGDDYAADHTVKDLPPNVTIVSATFALKNRRADTTGFLLQRTVTSVPSAQGVITNPGTAAGDGTTTAEVFLSFTFTETATLVAGQTYFYFLSVITNTGLHYTSELDSTVSTLSGGALG